LTGYVQTVASPFGLWRWQFTYTQMIKAEARRYRGFITALHGGANATRVTFKDPDEMSRAEQGVTMTAREESVGVSWSNGATWSNGLGWACPPPLVYLAAAAAKDATTITLNTDALPAGTYANAELTVGTITDTVLQSLTISAGANTGIQLATGVADDAVAACPQAGPPAAAAGRRAVQQRLVPPRHRQGGRPCQ
jgi:hypothetical protein